MDVTLRAGFERAIVDVNAVMLYKPPGMVSCCAPLRRRMRSICDESLTTVAEAAVVMRGADGSLTSAMKT